LTDGEQLTRADWRGSSGRGRR